MDKNMTDIHRHKESYLVILCSLLILIISFFFRHHLYGVFGEQNYLTVHLIMEFLIVTISFTISIQSWMVFPHILSSYRLWVGALFFSLGIIEIAHAISFKGMPFFLSESSAYKATWFFIAARLTEVCGILLIVATKDRTVSPKRRLLAYSVSVVYSAFWLIIVFLPSHFFPELVREGIGTTALKNNLEYAGMILELFIIYFAVRRFKSREVFNLMLIIASVYMIVADYFFTSYKNVYDINNFLGHLFQFAGFYFLQRAVYHTSVEEPFEKQKEILEKIQYMAFHDELTNLPNLRFLSEKWAEIVNKNPQKKIVLFILDIDRFKKINEALGHSVGDLILQAAAARFQESLLPNMFIGRVTGDQFAVIFPEGENKELIMETVGKIQGSLNRPLQTQHLQLNITLSMGASIYPDHGTDFDKLLQRANFAILEARQENQSFGIFRDEMDGKALDMLVLENDLYHALSRNELFIVYQPQVNICTGDIVGVEALLRWRHPEKGLISPGQFIPIAERTGLIIPIGEWVLQTSCRKIKEWQDAGRPPLIVAVNLSTRQLYQQNLVEKVREILKETQLSPQYLELEITESMLMDVDYTKKTLEELKKVGIHISIDDFGTGYSSLSYLKELPIDRIKIDQSFVRDLREDNTSFVSMIISLSEHLKMNVIAEGVETAAQKDILYNLKCHEIQGYEFSPPLEINELIKSFSLLHGKSKESAVKYQTMNTVYQ